jgi:hypothetical protein
MLIQNLIEFDHVGERVLYREPRAFGWGAQLGGARSSVVEHVKQDKVRKR